MRAFLTLIVSVFLLLAAEPAWAAGDRRVALVIGNSVYRKFPALPNPRNDAEDVTSALKQVGFTVLGGTDLTREQMRDSLRQFARTAQDAEAALVFYAGHGLQYRGRNYLVPVDARLEDEFDLEYETVRVDDVVEELNRADGPRILILDACRNLPLSTRSRDPFSSTGLAKLSGRGLIVAYATQANQVAYDGTGRNSIFTSAFLKSVQEPGLDVTQVFQRVSMSVDQVTQGRQTPELSMSYPGHFYLNRGETEREAWPKARASNDPQLLREFIAKYPNSFLVPDAKDMIQRLEARGVARGDRNPQQAEQPQPPSTLQLAHRPDAAAAARAREEEERLAWQRLQEEQRRRAETRRQAERERAAAAEQERQRQLQEEERRRSEARKAEQERLAEDARQKKLAEERVAAEARLEEERRQAEMRKAEQERLAEEARQRKLAEERAAAEARERQRMEREARLQEERRQAEIRKAEQERLAEEARQRKLAEERAAAEVRERQRLEREARLEEERRQVEARRAEQERLAEEARQKKLAEERAAAEARERQRLEREARFEEERRQAEVRRAEQERLAEEARQKKLAEERAAADARERQRLEREARIEEERRQAVARRLEQERLAEEARQRKLAEERAAAEARNRLAEEAARADEHRRKAAEAARAEQERVRLAAEQAERDRLAWAQLEEEQRRRATAAQAEVVAEATRPASDGSAQTTVEAIKSAVPSSKLAALTDSVAPRPVPDPPPMRLASVDAARPAATDQPPASSGFPKEVLDRDRLVRETKAELSRIGCFDDEPDGKWDKDAQAALRRFSRQVKLAPLPSEPNADLLDDLKRRPAHVCPLECGAGERPQRGQCVAVARPEAKPAARREPKPRAVAAERERRAPEPRAVRPRPSGPSQAPVSTASSAPKPAAPRAIMGVGF